MTNSTLIDNPSMGIYHAKLTDADTAIASVVSGSSVAIGMAAGQPPALLRALAARAERGEIDRVKLFYFHAEAPMAQTVLRYELMGRFLPHSLFLQRADRELIKRGDKDGRKVVYFIPTAFSQSVRLFAESIPIDTCIATVSPMDAHGYFTFGTNNDYTSSVARQAKHLIVEVNPNMPRTLGDSFLNVDRISAMIPVDDPLPERQPEPLDDVVRAIGRNVASLIPDGATLQMGIGKIPDAVLAALADRHDLGVHTEMMSDGVMDLVEAGVITGRRKNFLQGKLVTSFVMGTRRLYEWVHDNPLIEMRPSLFTNDPFQIARNDNMVAINAALAVDLTGQVAADTVRGRFFSGIGGQVDFIRGAARSKGGKPIIALPATAKGGSVSRIQAVFEEGTGVVTSRGDIHYVVTEYGIADLWGKNIAQRTDALISIAHPDFRTELLNEAKQRCFVFPG